MEKLLVLVAFCPFIPIIAGFAVGFYRYGKHKNSVRQEVKQQYRDAQAKGGVSSLYYKHPERRLFKKTFGIPVILGLFGSFLVLWLISVIFS